MIKKTLNYLLFSVVSSGIGFLTVMYMAKTITQEEMGIIGLFMAVLYMAPQLVSFASSGLVSINKAKLSNDNFIDFSKSYLTFGLINFIVIFVLSILIGLFFKEYWLLFIILPILSFFIFLVSFHQAELLQEGLSKSYGYYNLFNSIISALLTVLFLSYFSLSWDGRLWAMILGQCLVFMLMYKKSFNTLHQFKLTIDKVKFREFFKFGLPLFFGLGAGWILNQADNYIVLYFFSLKDVGIYAVAYSIGNIVNTINHAATNAIVPRLYSALSKKEGHQIIKKINFYYSLMILLFSLIVGISSYWYVPILFGEDYLQSSDIIFFISLAFGFNGIYRTTGGVIAFYKRNKLQMQLIYLSATINVIVSILLIPYFGIVSPAIGTMIAFIVLAYTSYYFGWKILKKEELNL
jgi:O-antigen/teichoic acid export membrane protein